MKDDQLDAKIKGIASGAITGIELYNSLLELQASGRILVQGEIIEYNGLKAVLATSDLRKSYPYSDTEQPLLFPFSKSTEVKDLGNGFFQINYGQSSALSLGDLNKGKIVVESFQYIVATDPRIGHKRGTPYPDQPDWWISRKEEASYKDPMCYGPYISLDAGVYDFFWEVELVSSDLAGVTDWGNWGNKYGFCGIDVVWNGGGSVLRTVGAIYLESLPKYESPAGSGVFKFAVGWQNVGLEVPLPDVECRLYNGWYGVVGTRGNPYRVNLTAKRLVVRKVG